jgi:hypothetical protein
VIARWEAFMDQTARKVSTDLPKGE